MADVSTLTQMQRDYIEARGQGLGKKASARAAGYADADSFKDLEKNEIIAAELKRIFAANAKKAQMTREKIVDGLLESIQIAKLQADAGSMIKGWSEVAKITGLAAPEVKKIEISGPAQQQRAQLEQMTDDELLRIAAGTVIEGEFSHVSDEEAEDDA